MKYAFGIDVGGTSVKLGLVSTDGELIEEWEIPTRTEDGGKNVLPDIAVSVKAKIKEKGIAADVVGAGIGLPGPVDEDGVIRKAVNLHWDRVFNVAEELSDLLDGMKVRAGNSLPRSYLFTTPKQASVYAGVPSSQWGLISSPLLSVPCESISSHIFLNILSA